MTSAPMTGSEPPLYFICYSRQQRDFVAKVEAKLAARRRRGELDVWRDVRNLDVWEEFTDVILAALERAAGAIVIISDVWYQSNYIQDHEWRTIRARQERDPWFKIFPLAFNDLDSHDPLRSRNFVNDLTDELLLHCSDAMRDRILTRLSNLIGDHAGSVHQRSAPPAEPSPATAVPAELVPPGGFGDPQPAGSVEVLDGVPELPEHFVEPEELDALSAQVAAGRLIAVTGLQGEGGTGKSVLAAAVARRTARLFSGGVHWVTVGERATSEDVRQMQAGLLSRLGGHLDHAPRDITEGREMLMAALAARAALVVVEDVWASLAHPGIRRRAGRRTGAGAVHHSIPRDIAHRKRGAAADAPGTPRRRGVPRLPPRWIARHRGGSGCVARRGGRATARAGGPRGNGGRRGLLDAGVVTPQGPGGPVRLR